MINYVEFNAGSKEYRLVLNTRSIVALEKSIGMNPLSVFGEGADVPPVTVMVAILHASMQKYNHGITIDKAYDIFDEYLADGNSVADFIYVIFEIYKASGLISDNAGEEKN